MEYCCMCELTIIPHCPHCHRSKVVKNGKSRAGVQRLFCKHCHKHFQQDYLYWGANPVNKKMIIRMLQRGNGIRDCSHILQVSKQCVSNCLISQFEQARPKEVVGSYEQVQVDELWTYVHKKKNKRWLLYAYAPESKQILAWQWGKRDTATVKKLYHQLQGVEINWWCTDHWKAFAKVLPYERHLIGKQFTRAIEGVNTSLRARNKRIARKTTCFSKRKQFHEMAMKLIILDRNNEHHIF